MSYKTYNIRREYMKEYMVEFYATKDGREPAKEFLESLDAKMIAKILKIIELLEVNGPSLRLPYTEHLGDGIFEIRAKQGSDIARVLYFFVIGKKIVLTNGFVKKTQKTPKREIEKAKRFRFDYGRRDGI